MSVASTDGGSSTRCSSSSSSSAAAAAAAASSSLPVSCSASVSDYDDRFSVSVSPANGTDIGRCSNDLSTDGKSTVDCPVRFDPRRPHPD